MRLVNRCILPFVIALLVGSLSAQNLPAPVQPTTAIRFGKLLDGSGKVLTNAIVVVQNDRIKSVGQDNSGIPPHAQIIDLRGYTGLPGLIDVHTHMTYAWDHAPGTNPLTELFKRLPQETVYLAQDNARRSLEIGVTSVRDLMAENYSDIAMRNLINQGAMVGPRMFVAGPAVGIAYDAPKYGNVFPWIVPRQGEADGVPEVQHVIRQEVAAGVDVIKMFASTGGFNEVDTHQTYTYAEIQAAVDTAHLLGKKIAVHSYGPGGAKDAARAGADSIEHAVDIDDATLAEMARRHVIYVPTVYHNVWYAENKKLFNWNDQDVANLYAYEKRNLETVRRAVKAGVPLAMGSDAVFDLFGKQTNELTYLVQAGMTPQQALNAATVNGAILVDRENTLGKIAPNYYADIIAVEGDPTNDINAVVSGVKWVMKDGKVVVDKINVHRVAQ